MKFFIVAEKKSLKIYGNPFRSVALSNICREVLWAHEIPTMWVLGIYLIDCYTICRVFGPINDICFETNMYYSVHLFHQRCLPTVLATSASPAKGRDGEDLQKFGDVVTSSQYFYLVECIVLKLGNNFFFLPIFWGSQLFYKPPWVHNATMKNRFLWLKP